MEIKSEKNQVFTFLLSNFWMIYFYSEDAAHFFCLFGAQPLCCLIYLRDLGPCHFVRGFLWGPKCSRVSYIIIFKVFIFQYFGYFKVFIFQYFGSLKRVSWFITLYLNYVRYLKRWEPSYVFFNCYWAAMNPAKGQIWMVLAFYFKWEDSA